MPGSHERLKSRPNNNSSGRDTPVRNASPRQTKEQASVATLRAYYEPAQQPPSVSQQTSASAIRDMALRKGILTTSHKEEGPRSGPLKSALKRYRSTRRGQAQHPQSLCYPEQEQLPVPVSRQSSHFSRIGDFLRRSSIAKSARSPQVSSTPSTISVASKDYSRSVGPRRQGSIGWDQSLQQYDASRTSSAQSDHFDVVRRPGLAQGHVYEEANMHIKRLPRGISNWFDANAIDSDEDYLAPVELPATEALHASEALPSTFTLFSPSSEPSQGAERSRRCQILQSRQQMSAEQAVDSGTDVARLAPGTCDENTQIRYHLHHPSDADQYLDFRPATPKASQQMRTRSDHKHGAPASDFSAINAGDTGLNEVGCPSMPYQYSFEPEHAYKPGGAVDMQRPDIPPRKLQSSQIALHNAYHVNETQCLTSRNSSSRHFHWSRKIEDESENRPSTLHEKSHRPASIFPRSRGLRSAHVSSSHNDRIGGASIDAISPELSHMMVVTEEEMALLEMMRTKRAAMQKNVGSKGYRQALEREHEHLVQRRLLAQQTALRILRTQQECEVVQQRKDIEERTVHEREIRRLDELRQREIDRTQRLEKFLAMDTSLAAALDNTEARMSRDDLVQDRSLPAPDVINSSGKRDKRTGNSTRPSESGQRGVCDEIADSKLHSKSIRSGANDLDKALTFPEPPKNPSARHQQAPSRAVTWNLPIHELASNATQTEACRMNQAPHAKHTKGDAKFRQELHMIDLQATIRSQKSPQLSQQQRKSATLLCGRSGYYAPENSSITSHGSASVSASNTSPRTASATSATHTDELLGNDAFADEQVEYPGRSSADMMTSKSCSHSVRLRNKNVFPSALSIEPKANRSSYRASLASSDSAGEDVLAAWAELGGNENMLPSRSCKRKGL